MYGDYYDDDWGMDDDYDVGDDNPKKKPVKPIDGNTNPLGEGNDVVVVGELRDKNIRSTGIKIYDNAPGVDTNNNWHPPMAANPAGIGGSDGDPLAENLEDGVDEGKEGHSEEDRDERDRGEDWGIVFFIQFEARAGGPLFNPKYRVTTSGSGGLVFDTKGNFGIYHTVSIGFCKGGGAFAGFSGGAFYGKDISVINDLGINTGLASKKFSGEFNIAWPSNLGSTIGIPKLSKGVGVLGYAEVSATTIVKSANIFTGTYSDLQEVLSSFNGEEKSYLLQIMIETINKYK